MKQARAGRLYMLEHPVGAATWITEAISALSRAEGVQFVNFDFCMMGMKSTNARGEEGPAKKRTRVATNSQRIAQILKAAQCSGKHQHVTLEGGKPKKCEEYPEVFCRMICEGIKKEIEDDKWIDVLY